MICFVLCCGFLCRRRASRRIRVSRSFRVLVLDIWKMFDFILCVCLLLFVVVLCVVVCV